MSYSIYPSDDANFITGTLFLTSALTHLGAASLKLLITAQDGGGLTSAKPAEVTITILPSAQAPVVFQKSRYNFSVSEDAAAGTSVGTVAAKDPVGECGIRTS